MSLWEKKVDRKKFDKKNCRKKKSKFDFFDFFKNRGEKNRKSKIFDFRSEFSKFRLFRKKISKKCVFSKKFFQLFSKSFQYVLMKFLSGFSFRPAAPVQGACVAQNVCHRIGKPEKLSFTDPENCHWCNVSDVQ